MDIDAEALFRGLLDGARDLSSGREGPPDLAIEVVPRKDGQQAIAFLVSFAETWGSGQRGPWFVFPLSAGKNVVCRDAGVGDHETVSAKLMEQGQWRIDCEASGTRVRDGWSTNLSAIVPTNTPFTEDSRLPGISTTGRIPIDHANANPSDTEGVSLFPGDALIGYYASFGFGLV